MSLTKVKKKTGRTRLKGGSDSKPPGDRSQHPVDGNQLGTIKEAKEVESVLRASTQDPAPIDRAHLCEESSSLSPPLSGSLTSRGNSPIVFKGPVL